MVYMTNQKEGGNKRIRAISYMVALFLLLYIYIEKKYE